MSLTRACCDCNVALGAFQDNVSYLRTAIQYLQRKVA